MSAGSLARIEAAEVSPSVDTLLDVADGLGIPVGKLVVAAEEPEAGQSAVASPPTIGSDERRMLDALQRLEPEQRALVVGMAEELARSRSSVAESATPRHTPTPSVAGAVAFGAVGHYLLG